MSHLLVQADVMPRQHGAAWSGIPLRDKSVHMVCTSPPYFNLRDYQTGRWEGGDPSCNHLEVHPQNRDGRETPGGKGGSFPTSERAYRRMCGRCGARRIDRQVGLEETHHEYVANMVAIFAEIHRVLRDDGSVWLNLGDSYNANGRKGHGIGIGYKQGTNRASANGHDHPRPTARGLKPKDLIGIPWRVALALQDWGWYLRSEIIWCLSGGTYVYARTQKGEMSTTIHNLVRLDPSTVQLWNGEKWTQVLGWNRSADPERRIEIVLRSGERIGCTGNHVWPTQRGNVRADELGPGDVIRTCTLPDSPRPRPAYLTDDALWFVGLYLAEGSMADDTIQISGHADEVDRIPRIRAMAAHYGGSMTYTLKGNNLHIRVYGRVIRAILETYIGGKEAKDKHLKVASWSLPNQSLRMIADGYLDGDGHYDERNGRFRLGFCRNYYLERDLRTMAARLGAALTLKPTVATSQWGKFPAFKGEWRWDRSGHWNQKDRGEVVEIRASRGRHFWDIGVADEPHLFALASGVLTHNSKRNPMTESVADRPGRAHEQIFLLTKRPRYYYDREAVRQPLARASQFRGHPTDKRHVDGKAIDSLVDLAGRNLRTVWDVPVAGSREKHYAAYPARLVENCVKAGTSEKGVCPACGAPCVRIVEKKRIPTRPGNNSKVYVDSEGSPYEQHSGSVVGNRDPHRHVTMTVTLGWRPSCGCGIDWTAPAIVLDPFAGTSTTGRVALDLGRRYVGLDLKRDYLDISARRLAEPARRKVEKRPRRVPVPRQPSFFDSLEE